MRRTRNERRKSHCVHFPELMHRDTKRLAYEGPAAAPDSFDKEAMQLSYAVQVCSATPGP